MKKEKPDDYFNNGEFEIARYGKHVSMKNIMSKTQQESYINKLASSYDGIKDEIDKLVIKIREKVTSCDPVLLLSFAADRVFQNMLGKSSEIQSGSDDFGIQRMTEYIQSVLVSSPNKYVVSDEENDSSELFFSIQEDIDELYRKINTFYMSWGMCIRDKHPEWEKYASTLMEAQFRFLVRGQRYQVFEIEYFEKLLIPHDNIFRQLFSISAADIVEGISKLQYSLSQGKAAALNKLVEMFDDFCENAGDDPEKYIENKREDPYTLFNDIFGTQLRNVVEVTGWNERFIEELSYGLNQDVCFFAPSEFSGWPIIDLPVQKRPFIKISDKYYCFDYYTFMDNIYRIIQKTVKRLDESYLWADIQQETSENMVADVYKQLLPGCVIYQNNYYPINKSWNRAAENDLLILYAGVLIIVEVKAGSFIYTAPITDFESHIKSYKSLIEKADWQCQRTYDYLFSEKSPQIYGQDHNPKTQIEMNKIVDVFMMTVTIDNINDFAAKAEKLSFLNLKSKAISLSIDDLMVYRTYFDSPLIFLHYLKQRRAATQEGKIALNDELDHLGMYIKHNCYSLQVAEIPQNTLSSFFGYREELDEYFSKLYHPKLLPQKPIRELPELFEQILDFLETAEADNKIELSNYLLDFSTDAKDQLCKKVAAALEREKQTNGIIAIHSGGTGMFLRYTCFVNQPGIQAYSDEKKRKHALSSLVRNTESDRAILDIYFENDSFKKISYQRLFPETVLPDEYIELMSLGEEIAMIRVERAQHKFPGKIGRNDLCPCGSGKKFKKCCGK
ncbi:MAG: hypothetical protein GX677_08455 [Treponema sp.]|nr:hypothetical protein [Treponema sp.]